MATVTVTFEILDSELQEGWGRDGRTPEQIRTECAGSVRARLNAIIGDDGGEYRPNILSVAVESTGDLAQTIDCDSGVFHVVSDDEISGDDAGKYREYRRELRRRGYELATDADAVAQEHLVHVATGRFLEGYVDSEAGVDVYLWSDFGSSVRPADFETTAAYLDAFEERFAALWRRWDEQ